MKDLKIWMRTAHLFPASLEPASFSLDQGVDRLWVVEVARETEFFEIHQGAEKTLAFIVFNLIWKYSIFLMNLFFPNEPRISMFLSV